MFHSTVINECEKTRDKNISTKVVDMSKFKIYLLNDTHAYFNGSYEYLVDVPSPFKVKIHTEFKSGGRWFLRAFNRKYDDFCLAQKNPLEPTYKYYYNQQGCPIAKGVSFIINIDILFHIFLF